MLTSAFSSLYLCHTQKQSVYLIFGVGLTSTIGCFYRYAKLAGLAASTRVRGLNMWSVYTLNSVWDCLSPRMAASRCLPEVYVKPQNKKIISLRLSSSAFAAPACASLHHCNLSAFYSWRVLIHSRSLIKSSPFHSLYKSKSHLPPSF